MGPSKKARVLIFMDGCFEEQGERRRGGDTQEEEDKGEDS